MWPATILDHLNRIPHSTTIENKYFGPYNSILSQVCFFDAPGFAVTPYYALPIAQAGGASQMDFIVTYVVTVNDKPVLFIEIKPPGHLENISTRIDADEQMRDRFRSLYDLTTYERIYGVSAMGKRLAFYILDKQTERLTPAFPSPSEDFVSDTVPAETWNTDITTEDGYMRFMAVVDQVKQMAQCEYQFSMLYKTKN